MKHLAIDHGTKSGLAIYVESKEIYTNTFTLEAQGKIPKLLEFRNIIESILDTEKPDIVYTEEAKHLQNATVLRFLVGLYTIVVVEAHKRGIKIVECNPTSVKKKVAGSGRATKEEVANSILEKYNVSEEFLLDKTYYKKEPNKVKTVAYDKSDALALILSNVQANEFMVK